MELLSGTLGSNIQKTRDPKRKFAAKEYFDEINSYTQVIDLRSGDTIQLEEGVDKYGIIDIQLLDFAGSVFLDRDRKIKSGFNHLFHRDETSIETDLLIHKLRLVRLMRKYEYQQAMDEYQKIIKFGEIVGDKFTEFRYTCLKGRILMRWRKLDKAKIEFEKAFALLDTKFTEEDKIQLKQYRKLRSEPSFSNPNWDTIIIDYNESWLTYLYCATQFMADNLFDPPVLPILVEIEEHTTNNKSHQVLIDVLQLKAEIYLMAGKLDEAEKDIRKAIVLAEQNHLQNIEFEIFADLIKALINILIFTYQFNLAESELLKFLELVENDTDKSKYGLYLVMKVDYNCFRGNIRESFENLKLLTNLYKNFPAIKLFEPLFIAKQFFQYVIQGIYLDELMEYKEISSLILEINKIAQTTEVANIYSTLIKVHYELTAKSVSKGINEYENSKNQLDILLKNTSINETRYYLIIVYYINLTISYTNKVDYAISDLRILLNKFYENLISSPHVVLTIKIEVIKKTLENKLNDLPNWLNSIKQKYDSLIINNLIDEINQGISDSTTDQQFFINLLRDEIYLMKHENIHTTSMITTLN